ncbi:MAG TPA: carboxypeptidase-like regulatory domain-containing protein [Vicinamibacterales bacterium]|nr:carboxypeptidase-like regulatory domain-containing protein [Vicinamibacterales bacterium]
MQWSWIARGLTEAMMIAILTQTQTQPPRSGQTPVAGAAQISGLVKSAAGDAPIGRARVSAMSDALPEARVTISRADGTYAITDLPAGNYTISVTRTGFAPQAYGQARAQAGTPIAVGAGEHVRGIDVALVPAGSISGRIMDEDGTPFAGAVVEAVITRFESGSDTLFSVASAQTDDRGEFRLFGLAPGPYYVSAGDPAFRSVSTPKGVLHYSPTYYPGVASADQARQITVNAKGESPRAEFRLQLVPPARVTGRLLSFDARQLLNGAIMMNPIEGEGIPIVPAIDPSIQPDGRFSFGQVVPGRYQIRARAQTDKAGAALFAVFTIDVHGTDVGGVNMTLRPGAVVDGKLIVERTRGTPAPALPTIRVRAPFADGNGFGDALTGTVQPSGAFALRGLMKGSHQLVVDGLQPPWVLKSIVHHGSDLTDLPIDVAEKQEFRDVRITITDAGSDVSGVVRDARDLPVAHTAVLVFPRIPLYWIRTNRRMRIVYTDPDGRFNLPGLPAGEYLAVASASVNQTDLGKRDRLKALTDVGVPFRLETDDARATLTLPFVAIPWTAAVR